MKEKLSVQTMIRLEPSLNEWLSSQADRRRIPVAQLVREMLWAQFDAHKSNQDVQEASK